MSITRERLNRMREVDLQQQVLIPLFRAMGFKDVRPFHGGALEQGKDLVMCEPDRLKEKIHYAVVVKATKISGKATGKASAAEVKFQIDQAFGSMYLDSGTMQDVHADRCIVVTSKEITKEARQTLNSVLTTQKLGRVVDFIDGQKLFELCEKYLGPRTVWQKFEDLQKCLESASDDYRVVVNTSGGRRAFSFEPKHPKAGPLEVGVKLDFSFGENGGPAKEAFERYVKTGAPARVPGEFIKELKWPGFFQPLMDGIKVTEMNLGARRGTKPVRVNVELACESRPTATLSNVILVNIQSGSEEVTLSNAEQEIPSKFEFVFNAREKTITFTFSSRYSGFNVRAVLETIQFEQNLEVGGIFKIIAADTGISLAAGPLPQGWVPPTEDWIKLVRRLDFIQGKLEQPVTIPDTLGVSARDAATIESVARMLEGLIVPIRMERLILPMTCEEASEFMQAGTSGSLLQKVEQPIMQILGNTIRMPVMEFRYYGFYIKASELAKIIHGIESKSERIEVRLAFNDQSLCQALIPSLCEVQGPAL